MYTVIGYYSKCMSPSVAGASIIFSNSEHAGRFVVVTKVEDVVHILTTVKRQFSFSSIFVCHIVCKSGLLHSITCHW